MSVKLSLSKFQPKKLVLLNHNIEESNLITYCTQKLGLRNITVADQPVSLIDALTVQSIKIDKEEYNQLSFMQVDDYEIAYISGEVEEATNQLLFRMRMDRPPRNFGLLVGKLDLTRLRQTLLENGFRAEFRQGKLLVNEKILVDSKLTRNGTNHYFLEGMICQEYYQIRDFLYAQQLFI